MTTVGAVLQSIVSGKSIQTMERPAQDGEYGILKVSAVTWGEFRPQQNKAMPADYQPGECPRPMNGDILISRANTRELVGAPVLVRGDHPQLLLSDKILKLIPNRALVDREYLVRALRFPTATAHFFKCAGGSSGSMTNITQGDIRSAPIPLPPLEEQRRIAAILDQAETLRSQRCAALAQLDGLTQSLFLEMFGDPVVNPKKLPFVKFGDVGTLDRGISKHRPRNAPELLGGDHPLVQTGEVSNCDGYIRSYKNTYSDIGLRQSKLWPAGTLCITIAANIAKTGILTFDACFPDSVVGFRADDPATVEYVRVWLSFLQKALEDSAPESAQKNINLAILRGLNIPLPSIALQQTFATRIQAIESLKTTHRTALSELDDLFASLQQRAFAGEL
jgi:type I restriction enzyme S subunit